MTNTLREHLTDTIPGLDEGDIMEAMGALVGASTTFVDWECLHDGRPGAVSKPGLVLLEIQRLVVTR